MRHCLCYTRCGTVAGKKINSMFFIRWGRSDDRVDGLPLNYVLLPGTKAMDISRKFGCLWDFFVVVD